MFYNILGEKMEDKFAPELQLSPQEVSDLAGMVTHPGFKVFLKIGKSAVSQFDVDLLNQEDDIKVLRAHKYARVSAKLFTMWLDRINQEVGDFTTHFREKDKIVDSGASLDLGEFTAESYEEEEP